MGRAQGVRAEWRRSGAEGALSEGNARIAIHGDGADLRLASGRARRVNSRPHRERRGRDESVRSNAGAEAERADTGNAEKADRIKPKNAGPDLQPRSRNQATGTEGTVPTQ